MNSLNNKALEFKDTDIETELIMFLENISKKKNTLKVSTSDEMDACVHMFCKDLEVNQLVEELIDVKITVVYLSDELSTYEFLFSNRDSENQFTSSTTSNEVQKSNNRK